MRTPAAIAEEEAQIGALSQACTAGIWMFVSVSAAESPFWDTLPPSSSHVKGRRQQMAGECRLSGPRLP